MKASAIRQKYLAFFQRQGHALIPPAPLMPESDATTLFTSSGMQQLIPYLKGESHPMGKRLVNSQPSFRAEDIEEVGDNRHTTVFEMLGNWSLGDYFKKDQLAWIWEFLTVELGLAPARLHITLFAGDDFVSKDEESYAIWHQLGVAEDHLHYYGADKNWWSRAGEPAQMPSGEIGGPDSEVFYDFGPDLNLHENSLFSNQQCHVNCNCGRFLEIGNSVFMQYEKTAIGMRPLPQNNVDFGGGLERLAAAVQKTPDIFQIDLFVPIIAAIEKATGKKYQEAFQQPMRVIADHLRAATFMGAQGLVPGNKLQGYVMRRLLRRAAVKARLLGGNIKDIFLAGIPPIVKEYREAGFLSARAEATVKDIISTELDKFARVIVRGEKEIAKRGTAIDEHLAFDLYQSLGFPFEITAELVATKGVTLDRKKFAALLSAHKNASRTASAGMFKGGLAGNGQVLTRYHTATHLFHQALIDVLGDEVSQAGSNITAERLRFDYTCPFKPTSAQLEKVTAIVNSKILANLPVHKTVMVKKKALRAGARAFFPEKYPQRVTVYTIGRDPERDWYSKELCGGPHVSTTGEIGVVKIIKDKALSSGIRRLYAQFA